MKQLILYVFILLFSFSQASAISVDDFSLADLGFRGFVVEANLDSSGSAQVLYGKTGALGSSTSIASSSSEHLLQVDGLESGTVYFYRVVGKDSQGNSYTSAISLTRTAQLTTSTDFRIPYCQQYNSIAGGRNYPNILSSQDADIHINSPIAGEDFKEIVENAQSYSVVFIDGDITIDLTGVRIVEIPPGVTIASDRGVSQGALILTNDYATYTTNAELGGPLFKVGGDNVRFTGLRFQGPVRDAGSKNRDDWKVKFGISIIDYNNLQVDNNEVYGWPFAAIGIGYPGGYSKKSVGNKVHNNYIHSNLQYGLGYGIQMDGGFVDIFANEFYSNRHDIAGTGRKDAGYEAYCNLIRQGGLSHNFDMHGDNGDKSPYAGDFIHIHHNIFEDVGGDLRYHSSATNKNYENIKIRGRPIQESIIENNIFYHKDANTAIKQWNPDPNARGNLVIRNNEFDKKLLGEAKLLFASGFEGDISITSPAGGYQRVLGKDSQTGFSWPPQLLGTSNNGIHRILDSGGPGIENELQTVIGYDGSPTKVMYNRINSKDGVTQTPYQLNNVQENPDELYIKYRMKVPARQYQEPNRWHAIFEYKTDGYGSGNGYRLIAYIYTDKNGRPYWRWQGDTNPSTSVWGFSNFDVPVPLDEWFEVEYYIKWSKSTDGISWMKVNNQLIGEHKGSTTANNQDLGFIILTQLYGNIPVPNEQWVDDIEIWDGIPGDLS